MPVTQVGGALVADETILQRAAEVSASVASHGAANVVVESPSGDRRIVFDPDLSDFVLRVLDSLSNGPLSITGLPDEVTTTIAADMLGISRPTLMKRIAAGDISAHRVGSHSRLLTEDVLRLRDQDAESRRVAFDELRRIDEEADIRV